MREIQSILQNLGFTPATSDDKTARQLSLQCIRNPDGSIRWIWPTRSVHPLFLKFYNQQGWKGKALSWVIRLVFSLQLHPYLFKRSILQIHHADLAHTLDISKHNWALFTGTPGPNRKYIIYTNSGSGAGLFTKIALNKQSQQLLENEEATLRQLAKIEHANLHFPEIEQAATGHLSLTENLAFDRRTNQWTSQHSQFYGILQKLNAKEVPYHEFAASHQFEKRIKALEQKQQQTPSGMVKKLALLHQSLGGAQVEIHLTHGDFTPWNMLVQKDGKLYVYEWELSAADYPSGFDFFHFLIQNEILTGRGNWLEIKNQINETLENCQLTHEFSEHEISKYISCYLLVNVLNYIEIYEKQAQWHTQINWLLQTWNAAISDVLAANVNNRELLILDVFDFLHSHNYAALKLPAQPEKLSAYSDLDILMTSALARLVIKFLKQHPLVKKVNVISGFALTKVRIQTLDGAILHLDCIHQLKRRSLEYLSVRELLKRPSVNRNGIKSVNASDSLCFLGLFYGLNKATVPLKFGVLNQSISKGNQALNSLLNELLAGGQPNQKALIREIKKTPLNRGCQGLKNSLTYVFDTVKNSIQQKGIVITFSGVDGAGKSTMIQEVRKEIEKRIRKQVVVLRHRPSIFPILSSWSKGRAEAEKMAELSLPRQGNNHNILSSTLRFAYYFLDYFLGQFYIYFRYTLLGTVVLYDRYYFDFINDSVRSNIRLPKWLIKQGYKLLLKPQLNFFLYADATTILSRKRELDGHTIESLTKAYLSLFEELSRKNQDSSQYIAIENIHIECSLQSISAAIQAKLI